MKDIIEISQDTFDVNGLTNWLSSSPQDGAIATFIGKVRSTETERISLFLEHYEAMTKKVLTKIVEKARERWTLNRVVVVHRVGEISDNQQIVFIGVSCAHRASAFEAVQFIMDVLKNEAPFWKKEKTKSGESWVQAKKTDKDALKKWY